MNRGEAFAAKVYVHCSLYCVAQLFNVSIVNVVSAVSKRCKRYNVALLHLVIIVELQQISNEN